VDANGNIPKANFPSLPYVVIKGDPYIHTHRQAFECVLLVCGAVASRA